MLFKKNKKKIIQKEKKQNKQTRQRNRQKKKRRIIKLFGNRNISENTCLQLLMYIFMCVYTCI